jgi:hypothetical protein
MGSKPSRRQFLGQTAAGGVLAAAGLPRRAIAQAAPPRRATYLVPGYRTEIASYRGRPAEEAPELRADFPNNYAGGVTLVTRLAEDGGVPVRALLPVTGHHIAPDPAGKRAWFSGMNATQSVVFDIAAMRLERIVPPHASGFVTGGHAAFTPEGKYLLSTERRSFDAPFINPAERNGRLVIRDARDLSVLASYDSFGIASHDLRLTKDGTHAVIANYGSVDLPPAGSRPTIIEPSLTVLELASGRLIHKWLAPMEDAELRHIAAHGLNRIAAVMFRMGGEADERALNAGREGVFEPDILAEPGRVYLPAPVVMFGADRPGGNPTAAMPENPLLARQGQSIVYDPRHDEMLVTFGTSHTLIAFGASDGGIRKFLRLDRLGLRYPRGVVLHPDGEHFAVSGGWQGIQLFRRGTHEPVPSRALHTVFFDHSHLTVIPA